MCRSCDRIKRRQMDSPESLDLKNEPPDCGAGKLRLVSPSIGGTGRSASDLTWNVGRLCRAFKTDMAGNTQATAACSPDLPRALGQLPSADHQAPSAPEGNPFPFAALPLPPSPHSQPFQEAPLLPSATQHQAEVRRTLRTPLCLHSGELCHRGTLSLSFLLSDALFTPMAPGTERLTS